MNAQAHNAQLRTGFARVIVTLCATVWFCWCCSPREPPAPKRTPLMAEKLAKAAERHVAREGLTDAFIKALPRDKDWERYFPSSGLQDALTAISDGSDQDAASQKVGVDNPWASFLPTATELSKRLRQNSPASVAWFSLGRSRRTRLPAHIRRRIWTSLSFSMISALLSTTHCLIPSCSPVFRRKRITEYCNKL